MYDDLFKDLDKALVTKQEIRCFKQQVNGKVRWVIEIDDSHEAKRFDSKMNDFLERLKRRGEKNVSDSPTEEI